MRVTLEFHVAAERDVRRWYRSLGTTSTQREERFRFLVGAILVHLREHDGIPPEAVAEVRAHRPTYWCWFADDVLVKYVVLEEPPPPRGWWDVIRRVGRVFRKPRRRVVVTELAPRPARRDD